MDTRLVSSSEGTVSKVHANTGYVSCVIPSTGIKLACTENFFFMAWAIATPTHRF